MLFGLEQLGQKHNRLASSGVGTGLGDYFDIFFKGLPRAGDMLHRFSPQYPLSREMKALADEFSYVHAKIARKFDFDPPKNLAEAVKCNEIHHLSWYSPSERNLLHEIIKDSAILNFSLRAIAKVPPLRYVSLIDNRRPRAKKHSLTPPESIDETGAIDLSIWTLQQWEVFSGAWLLHGTFVYQDPEVIVQAGLKRFLLP